MRVNLKTLLHGLSLFTVLIVLMSFRFQTASGGSIGDVKYSVLDPEKFIEKNGKGWVLMDDRDIAGTDLSSFAGISKLPDARGVFIRGMNVNRKIEEGDPGGNRKMGGYQGDTLKKHWHYIADFNWGHTVNGNGDAARIDVDDGHPYNGAQGPLKTKEEGGDETRPRNITLYVYIKVSN